MAWVGLVERAERHTVAREALHAVRDGAYWGWAVALVAAVAVWVARGAPSPGSAAIAAALMPVGAALAWVRTWRRTTQADAVERRAAAAVSARRWLTGYGLAAALIPALTLAADRPAAAAVVGLVVVVALVELAIVTIPIRARWRLLARLRIAARAVARTDVRVGRALWRGMALVRVRVHYPPDWAAHAPARRDELVERMMWELCGPPPRTPDEAIARPDYTVEWDHVHCRMTLTRLPRLPRHLAARDWARPAGSIVLGQTQADDADVVSEGVPLALYTPRAHMLIAGGTQHGKSSGVRAWLVDGLTHGVWPGGVWAVDGKGSGSLAALAGRRGVHAVAHDPDEWAHVLQDLVAPEVARRYAEMLDWRAGQCADRPDHPRSLLVLDEVQQVLLARPDLASTLDTLARQALEAGVILWVITQRPDAKDAVPGAIRDQLLDRVTFGPLSGAGAKMVFDLAGDWHRALGVAPVPGRALTWLDGRWRTVQVPWLPIPADDPTAEALYPPPAAPQRTGSAQAPRPPSQVPQQSAPSPAYDPRTARRRRRT